MQFHFGAILPRHGFGWILIISGSGIAAEDVLCVFRFYDVNFVPLTSGHNHPVFIFFIHLSMIRIAAQPSFNFGLHSQTTWKKREFVADSSSDHSGTSLNQDPHPRFLTKHQRLLLVGISKPSLKEIGINNASAPSDVKSYKLQI